MKNVLICILSMLLSAAAFLSRPTERDFQRLVLELELADEPKDALRDAQPASARKKGTRSARAPRREPQRDSRDRGPERGRDNPLADAEFLDRIFWVEIRRDGKTLYAGCFNHWWDGAGRMLRA